MRRRVAWRRAVAIGAGAALGVAGLSTPAMAVLDNYPDDPAEAGASVLMSSVMEQELLGAATSDAGFPTNPGPNEGGLDVDLLGGQLLALGDIEIPVAQFIDFGQLGALSSVSEASSPLDGHAASGLIGPDGGLSLDSEEADWGTTTIDLLSVADAVGVGGITDQLVDRLDLELGAFGSEVIAEDGVFLDPDGGVTGPGQYIAGDASLWLHSPAIEDAAAQIHDLGGQVDTTVEDLANQVFDAAALAAALGVPGMPEPDCTIDSNMQENIVNAVVGEPLTSANQLITLDLSTGELEIHLEHLVEGGTDPWGGGDDAGLNGLPPNTEVINEGTYPQIAETVHELMEEAAQIMATAVQESLQSITFTCTFQGTGPLPGDVIDVTWGPFTLEDAVAGTFPAPVTNCAGPTAPALCLALVTAINTAGPVLSPVFASVYDFLISDEAAQVYELLINDIKTGLVTSTIGAALAPVFDVVQQFVSLQINHQETTTCALPDGTETIGSLEVSALSLGVMAGGTDLGRVGLGNSGVRVDACNLVAAGTIGDLVWDDANGDGIQDAGEPGVPDVTVNLLDAAEMQVGTTTTDADGAYLFTELPPGDYTVEFVAPDGTTFTTQDAGDDATDSDPDPATGLTGTVTLTADAPENLTVDAGLVPADPGVDPALSADPGEVVPGECTVVTGTGYTPNSTATVQLFDAEGNPVGDPIVVETDANGEFVTDLCVPEDAEPGDYTIIGTDDTTGLEGEAPLTVLPPTGIDPALSADPGEVVPGECTVVTGTGYTPNSTATVQLFDAEGNPVGDPIVVETDANGEFVTDLCVPEDAEPGDHTIIGTDDTTGLEAEAPLTIIPPDGVDPEIMADPDTVFPGDETVISGTGYTPDSTATVQLYDPEGNPVGDPIVVDTDENGEFSFPAVVQEDTVPGEYTIVGTDDTTGLEAEAPLTVLPPAGIDPSHVNDPAEVAAGDVTTVIGEGYTPDSTVTVQLVDAEGNPVGDPIVADTDADGSFTTPLTVPEGTEPGDGYATIVTDDTTGVQTEAPLEVLDGGGPGTPEPVLVADPDELPPGDCTMVTGTGYTPDSTATVQLFDAEGNPVGDPIVVDTDAEGGFTTEVCVPADAEPGDWTIVGTDDTSGIPAEAPITVTDGGADCSTSPPVLSTTTEVVMPGDEIDVTGTGFPAGVPTAVQLHDPEGNPVGEPVMVTPDETCAFELTLTIPEDAEPGVWEIVATPEDGSEGASVPVVVGGGDGEARELTAWFDHDVRTPGQEQTFRADGFEPGEAVTAMLHSSMLDLGEKTADENGEVWWTFTVPEGFDPGTHVGIATSVEQGDSAMATFDVPCPKCDGGDGDGDGNGHGDDCDHDGACGGHDGDGDGNGHGDGDGNGPGHDGDVDGDLAATGSDTAVLVAMSLLLLAAGATLIRRRQILARRSQA
ncbi:choice-of-anchor G family protein [Myceligenerans crystallogenes]|uniref:SD-repeat containing protein B domain-containing protein n=1 Tax=Myceligenerans crystallogenes TaxID=316335 RepID=A0ABN2N4G6_9MICO